MKKLLRVVVMASVGGAVLPAAAKLPPPNEEAKVNASIGAMNAAYANKVSAYQLCRAQDRVAEEYLARARAAGKAVEPAMALGSCPDPGPAPKQP